MKSRVEVNLSAALPLQKDLTAQLTLQKNGFERKGQMTLKQGEDSIPGSSFAFEQLEHGEYILTIQADGFETWQQKIVVEPQQAVRLEIYTGYLAGYDYAKNAVHPGALHIGDVDGDGTVSHQDKTALVDALAAQSASTQTMDFNGDGVADLLDLEYLANSLEYIDQGSQNTSTAQTRALTLPQEDENTTVKGSLESLMEGNGSVQLQPQSQQPISEENPVALTFDFSANQQEKADVQQMTIQSAQGENEISDGALTVVYLDENGEEQTMEVSLNDKARMARSGVSVNRDENGNLVVDFGSQIAVKKVTLTITGTKNNTNLAEISKVEFLNNTENRIPAPDMSIPQHVAATAGDKEFLVTWDNATNITGYEVEVSQNGKTETYMTTANQMLITSFAKDKLVNNTEYTVRVQSVNGQWKSGYSQSVTVRPMASKPPFAPDGVKVEGAYRALNVSWKAMKDTDSYSVYYRPYEQGEYIKVAEGITKNQYTITDLEPDAKYQVYVVGKNDVGESQPSLVAVGQTQNLNPVKMPDYKLINTSNGQGQVTAHIETVKRPRSTNVANMVNSPLDEGNQTALGLVDGEESSYYVVNDWDDGCVYPGRGGKGLTFVFDESQSIGSISFSEPSDKGLINKVRVEYYDAESKDFKQVNARLVRGKSENNRYYYTIKWEGAINTDQLHLAVSGWSPLQIAEVKFYAYDSISDDINGLFEDAYHTELRADVDEATIAQLEERLNTKDTVSGEYHPDRELLQKELDNARSILNTESLGQIYSVKNTITARSDNGYGFTGLNAWQPLGVVASEGDKLVIYVGANGKNIGDNTELNLIATQYHAESGEVMVDLGQLKIGRNEITVPATNTLDTEHGGALYIQYTGGNGGTQYGVRVSGGVQVPILDLYGVEDKEQRVALAQKYIEDLTAYNQTIQQLHEELHEGEYDEQNCILGATDILLDEMMLSLPVQQVLRGLSGTVEQQAQQLEQSMAAMDQMMELFYQHKGLNDNSPSAKLPSQHLNIRYQRMFGGAFMYAAGNHIGIEWNETLGMMQGSPVVADENGGYISGQFFGWGIGHEIGHNINQGSYAVAEVTNNYFAQLSEAKEGSDSVRFGYDAIYKKVTSNTLGDSNDVFTQLGMYWQLHLAYDNYQNYKVFEDYNQQLESLFYARVDTYARNTKAAPAPSGVALTLGKDTDQNFMRLATAAAQKDLTEFFQKWGKAPDAQTLAYAAQFPKEERAIYYVNDDARTYRINNPEGTGFAGQQVVADSSSVDVNGNAVTITINNSLANDGELLGYEVARVIINGGQESRQVVGFTTGDSFTDIVTGINNRVIRYEVTAIDQYLQRSAVHSLAPVKIAHDGSHDKSLWSISTNMLSEQDVLPPAHEHDPCAPEEESAISMTIDNKADTIYTGSAQGQAWVQLDFHKSLPVTGFKYTAGSANAIQNYKLEISTDGKTWKQVAEGTFAEGEKTNTVYLQNENKDPWVATYDASYLRLTVVGQDGQDISIAELDVLGPTGDNVDWRTDAEGAEALGILQEDYVYDSASGEMIPAGSLVFVGQYKGNPAYNVVLLLDENGDIVGGTDETGALVAQQIILADVPEHGELGETSDGSWIYWIEPSPESGFGTLPETVRAELYRVDNATTNEGQRLVSDSFALEMPEEIPTISLK